MRGKSKKILSVLLMVCFVCTQSIWTAFAQGEHSIQADKIKITDNCVTLDGNTDDLPNIDLKLDVSLENESVYSADTVTDENGKFHFSFTLPTEEHALTYAYTISEVPKADTIEKLFEDDFTVAKSGYTVTPPIISEEGNESPSANMMQGARMLKTISELKDGAYFVCADVRPPLFGNTQLFAATNSFGDSRGIDTSVNKVTSGGYTAFKTEARDNKLVLVCADNSVEQTSLFSQTLVENYDANKWYKIAVRFDTQSLALRVYVDDSEIAPETKKYILKQQDYNRIFDTQKSQAQWYLDNVSAEKQIHGLTYDISPLTGTLQLYGLEDIRAALSAVAASSEDTIATVLQEYNTVFSLDLNDGSPYADLQDKSKLYHAIAGKTYASISDFRKAFESLITFVSVCESDQDGILAAINANSDVLGVSLTPEQSVDADMAAVIYSNIETVTDFDDLKRLIDASVLLCALGKANETSAETVLDNCMTSLTEYGFTPNFSQADTECRQAVATALAGLQFDFSTNPSESISTAVKTLNAAYTAYMRAHTVYGICVTEKDCVDGMIKVSGAIEPAVAAELLMTVSDGSTVVGTASAQSDENGCFSLEYNAPQIKDNKTYNIMLSPAEKEKVYKTWYTDGFDAVGDFTVNTASESTETGKPSPAVKLCKAESGTDTRILKTVSEIASISGRFELDVDFMKADQGEVKKLYGVYESTGNKCVASFSSVGNDIFLNYYTKEGVARTVTAIQNYETEKWYHARLAINLETGTFKAYIDGRDIAPSENLTIRDGIADVARVMDAASGIGTYYLDNVSCKQDLTENLSISSEFISVFVPGTDRVAEALAALKQAEQTTFFEVLATYNDVYGIDMNCYTALSSEKIAAAEIIDSVYTTISEFRARYYCETALQLLKETASENYAKVLRQNADRLGIDCPIAVMSGEVFVRVFAQNMNPALSSDALRAMCKKIEVYAAILQSTQLSVTAVADFYADVLINWGLSSDYKTLINSQRAAVCKAVLASKQEQTDADVLLKNLITVMNQKITALQKEDTSSTGASYSPSSIKMPSSSTATVSNTDSSTSATFFDVPDSYWAYNEIMTLTKKKIINGMSNDIFSPEANITREEFVKLVVSAAGLPLEKGTLLFDDVVNNAWYAPYVFTAVKSGIVNGISEQKFGIGEKISREDAACILYRSRGQLNSKLQSISAVAEFADDVDISGYAKEAVYALQQCAVISGTDAVHFEPHNNLTRSQAAKLLYNMLYQSVQIGAESTTEGNNSEVDRAKKILAAYNIIFDQKSGEPYTKGEFAEIIAGVLKLSDVKENFYTDVTEDMDCYGSVNALHKLGVIGGGGAFYPNSFITLEQVCEIMVNALGFGYKADTIGYLATADSLKLLDGVESYVDTALHGIHADICAVMLCNLITTPYAYNNKISTDGSVKYETDDSQTLLTALLEGYYFEGRIEASPQSALIGYEQYIKEDKIYADGMYFDVGDTDIAHYLGYNTDIYAVKDSNGKYKVLCFFTDEGNKSIQIDIRDINSVMGFNAEDPYEDRIRPLITYDSGKKQLKLSADINVIYNGVASAQIVDEDFIADNGTVTAVDSDGNGSYDLLLIRKYEVFVVDSYDSVSQGIAFIDQSFKLDVSDTAKDIQIFKNGRRVDISYIAPKDVLCLYAAKTNNGSDLNTLDTLCIELSNTTLTAPVTELDTDNRIAVIEGTHYRYVNGLETEIHVGRAQKFYLDIDSNIIRTEIVSDDLVYAYFLKFIQESALDTHMKIRYMTTDGILHEAALADKVLYTGIDESGSYVYAKSCDNEKMFHIAESTLNRRQLVKLALTEGYVSQLKLPLDESENDNYAGYNENEFTLDSVSDGTRISQNRFVNESYTSMPGQTLTIIDYDDGNDSNIDMLYYSNGDYNTLSTVSSMVDEVYSYDATTQLTVSVLVVKLKPYNGAVVSAMDIFTNNIIIVDRVSKVAVSDGNETYCIKGLQNGTPVTLYAEDVDVGVKYTTNWSKVNTKTKVAELGFGDIIQAALNSKKKIEYINVLATFDEGTEFTQNTVGAYYATLNTVFGPVVKNYGNKTFRLANKTDRLYPMIGNIYICDTGKKTVSYCGGSAYLQDSSFDSQDWAFIRMRYNEVREIVIYRK